MFNPNPQNPRKISDKKLQLLKESISENGDLSGIIYNKRFNRLVGGHQRLKVIPHDAQITYVKKYNEATPAGTLSIGFLEYEGELFGYREVDWDEKKERVNLLGANKHGGDWDTGLLPNFLIELDTLLEDGELEKTGFEQWEWENILAGTALPDIELSDLGEAEERYSITIKCESEQDFKILQSKLDISGGKVSAKKVLEILK